MENELDDISNGLKDYKDVLTEFWTGFSKAVEASNDLTMSEITDTIDKELGAHFFPEKNDGTDPRKCPDCENGRLGIKLGKFGGFIGCSNYPTCKYTKPLILNDDEVSDNSASIPKNVSVDTLTLEQALFLLSLPKSIGFDGDEEVFVATGKFGPYVKKGDLFKNIPASTSIFDVDIKMAHDLLLGATPKQKAKELGLHPVDNKPVLYFKTGKFGPYVQHNRVFASVPSSVATEDTITLELAIEKLNPKEPKTLNPKKTEVKEKPNPKK